MKLTKAFVLLLIITLFACSQSDKTSSTQQLSYDETIALVFPDSSDVGEWHGRPLNMEAQSSLSISNGDANGSCGVKVMLTNSSDQSVLATVTTLFPFTDDPWELSREYTLAPGETKHIGNSQICHDGKNTSFEWKVRGASYVD